MTTQFFQQLDLNNISEIDEYIETESGAIQEIEEQIEEAEELSERITLEGLSPTLVASIENKFPGLMTNDMPNGGWFGDIGKDNLGVALERMDAKKAGLVAAVVAMVLALIRKIYKFFKANITPKDLEKTKTETNKVFEDLKETEITEPVQDVAREFPDKKTNEGLDEKQIEQLSKVVNKARSLLIHFSNTNFNKSSDAEVLNAVNHITNDFVNGVKNAGSTHLNKPNSVFSKANFDPKVRKLLKERINSFNYIEPEFKKFDREYEDFVVKLKKHMAEPDIIQAPTINPYNYADLVSTVLMVEEWMPETDEELEKLTTTASGVIKLSKMSEAWFKEITKPLPFNPNVKDYGKYMNEVLNDLQVCSKNMTNTSKHVENCTEILKGTDWVNHHKNFKTPHDSTFKIYRDSILVWKELIVAVTRSLGLAVAFINTSVKAFENDVNRMKELIRLNNTAMTILSSKN